MVGEIITWALEHGWIALALSLVVLVVLWKRYVKLEDGAMMMVKNAHIKEVEAAKQASDLVKEVLPVLRAMDKRGDRVESRLNDIRDAISNRNS